MVPVKGTPSDLKNMQKTIPAMAALGPAEMLFGIDAGDTDTAAAIQKACEAAKFGAYRVVPLARDPAWKFHLAYVNHTCISLASNELILRADIDTLLDRGVLAGREHVGPGRATCCSLGRRTAMRGLLGPLRRLALRVRARQKGGGFSGLYWIWRHNFYDDVDMARYMAINNGDDAWLAGRAMRGHGLVCLRAAGGTDLDRVNEDYDWTQFQLGVWLAANRETALRRGSAPVRHGRFKSLMAAAGTSAALGRPGILGAYLWALRNPHSEAAEQADDVSWEEWRCFRAGPIAEKMRAWKDAGKTGMEKKEGAAAISGRPS